MRCVCVEWGGWGGVGWGVRERAEGAPGSRREGPRGGAAGAAAERSDVPQGGLGDGGCWGGRSGRLGGTRTRDRWGEAMGGGRAAAAAVTLPRFEVSLTTETDTSAPNIISWRKLLAGKHANAKSVGGLRIGSGGAAAAAAADAAGGGDDAAAAVAALEARMGGGAGASGAFDAPAGAPDAAGKESPGGAGAKPAKFSMLGVITKFERMYAAAGQRSRGSDASDDGGDAGAGADATGGVDAAPGDAGGAGGGKGNGKKGENSNDSFYDTDDSFIDDEELYDEMDAAAENAAVDTKYDGFFVNAGALETTVNEKGAARIAAAAAAAAAASPLKRKGKGKGGGKASKKAKVGGGDTVQAWPVVTSPDGRSVGGEQYGSQTMTAVDSAAETVGIKIPPPPRLPAVGTKLKDILPKLKEAVAAEMERRAKLPPKNAGGSASPAKRAKMSRTLLELIADTGAVGAKRKLKVGGIDESSYTTVYNEISPIVAPLEIPVQPANVGIRRYICGTLAQVRQRRKALIGASSRKLEALRKHVDETLGEAGAKARAAAEEARNAAKQSQEDDFQDGNADKATSEQSAADKAAEAASVAVLTAAKKLEFKWDRTSERLFIESARFIEIRNNEEHMTEMHAKGQEPQPFKRACLSDSYYAEVTKCFPPGMYKTKEMSKVLTRLKWNAKKRAQPSL